MDRGSQIIMLLSVIAVGAAVFVVAKPRPGRFMLARVLDAERHRAAVQRVLVMNAIGCLTALAMIFLSNNSIIQSIGAPFAALFAPLWMLIELRLVLKSREPSPVPSRFRVSLEVPPSFVSYLSPPLELLNLAALIVPSILMLAGGNELGPWLFFLPIMIFMTLLVLLCVWMQAHERWVLPVEGAERYAELQHEKRTRMVRLLETGLVCWNVATGMIWICIAVGRAGPWNVGAILPVVIGGPGFVVAMAIQLPRLTRIADELALLAKTDALGTRGDGWRYGGLVYYAPSDAALFVPKRSGLGQTLNFARPAAWIFLAGVLLLPPLITVLAVVGSRG